MSKNNFQERLRKMEDTKQRFSIRKFSIGAASVLIGLTIFGMGNETVHAAEQPAQNQNGGVQTSAVNKEESDASKAKQEAETSVNVNSEVTENMQEVSVDQKANTAQLEKKAPASAVKEEKTVADPTPAKEQNATSKQDSASAQTSQPAVDSVKQNAKKTQQVGNDKAALATTINSEKTQQAGNGKAALATTITLNEPQSSVVEITESKATVQDKNSTTVKTAQELIDAIQKGTANTINIGANIDLGTISSYTNTNISNKRNIIIQSADGKQYTVDFSGYGFNMYSNDYGVTFKNLDLYGRSYYGIVRSAGSYTFDNVNYTGPELIYTDPGCNTTVNFYNTVTAHSVGSYKESSQWSQWVQGGNTQQVIQFAGGKNTINFNSGSDVTLTTTNSNVIEVDKGTTTINVKKGAKVSLNPHTHFFPEQHRMSMDGIARGIASNGDDTTLNIDGNLDINLTKKINGLFSSDKYLSGALYLNSGATINVNGNLNINSNGKPYYRSQGWDDPVYINGNATINVNGGSFKVNATNMDDYKGSIVTSNGTTTIAINPHGTFDVTGDGAKATGVSLGNGSTFTSTQPELFNISMPDGATAIAIKNGKVQFNGVKTSADSQPIGEIDITYNDGIPKVAKVTSYDEATTTATRTAVNKAKNKINLVAAGKEVDLKDIMFTKDADGNYIMSGIANTADNNGAYVYISVNGTVHQVAPTDSQTLYTVGPTGGPTSSQVPYTAETGADGEFSVNLGKLKDTDQVSLYAAKDFVTSDKDTKTVSEWMTSFYRDQLQKLVDEAPTVEGGSNYINATDSLKTAYANAISDGSAFLQNPSATSEQLEAAATAITTAKTALNGDLNKVKQDLEAAVDAAPDFENTSATYYNAASAKQQAYNTAISDGSEALKAQNPTVESLTDALNKINEAKSALDGQPTDKQALQAAVNKSKDVKDSNNYANADQNAKTAYDNAVTAAQGVLDNSNATQAQVTQALQDLNTANGKLNGDAKTEEVKQALEAAVKDAPNVRNTPAYYNAASAKQQAYNTAISDGSEALKAQNPTVESLTDALNKINEAKSALDGQPTDKQALQAAVNKSKDVKDSNNYANADQNAKTAYDNAVTAAQGVLDNSNATQAQVTQALQDLNTANGKLNGDAKTEEVKQALEAAVKDAPNVRNTPAYYNAASAKQQAYNTAIRDGSEALKAQNPTVESLTTALNKINEAKNALDGQPTDKQALQAAVNKSKDVKDSNNYANADQNAKTAYDNAVTAAQGVLDNSNATQAQVTQALQDLNTANGKLNGDAKTEAANRQALEDAVKEAPTVEKTDSKYYNGTEKAQDDYKNTVSEGQKVLDNANATADQIKTALDNINAAKGALDGDPTNKTVLQNSVDNAVDLDKSNADAQAKKDYTDALNKAKQVLAYPNATQQAVNEANAALTNAKTALDNSSALQNAKDALQRAVDAKSTTEKTPAYYNAASAKQQAYNTAISAGSDALKAQNPTVESLTTALNKINEAKSALDGKATDTSKLKAAVDNANTVKASNDYKDASADDQKQYDDAVKAGQQLLDPTTAPSPLTQADVDRAAKAITDAQSALTTSATTNVKDAKGKATADLTNAVDAAKKAIDQDTNLTEDERNAAKAQVDSDASAAKEAINKATTNDAVTSAATAGKVTIDKTVANAAIDNAAAGKNKAIDGSSLTDEEKNGIKDQVAQAVKTAKDIISAADTEQAVTTAQKNGVAAIDGIKVPTESATKTAADKAIDEALANKQAEINKSTTLTDEEK
ncbi:DUF1542 domain-containing protein, partial [Lactobacillus amylovorus]|uniref:DUF1542 domain-containing protein n=3 Tax=Lactobacillus amylovorus TaxID=1604 RepID=UPI003F97B000